MADAALSVLVPALLAVYGLRLALEIVALIRWGPGWRNRADG